MLSKIYAGLLTAVVVVAIGCSQSPVAPSPTPSAQSAAATTFSAVPGGANTAYGMKGTNVPFRGAVTGVLAVGPNPTTCGVRNFGVTDATGLALHMGQIAYHTEQCIARQPDGTTVIEGKRLVLTAANGDELHGTFTGTSRPAGSQTLVTAEFTFKGGTGRFENATGSAAMTAVLNTAVGPPFPGRWEWTGTIRY